eukprot:355890-Chlamydomonas_euryale.AAC.1
MAAAHAPALPTSACAHTLPHFSSVPPCVQAEARRSAVAAGVHARPHSSCSPPPACRLKRADVPTLLASVAGQGHSTVPWMSGVLATRAQRAAQEASIHEARTSQAVRLQALRDDEGLPMVGVSVWCGVGREGGKRALFLNHVEVHVMFVSIGPMDVWMEGDDVAQVQELLD